MPASPAARALDCDLLVVGGGINGCGIARDAAGRGLSVVLCEQDDLGAHTSSASTKLIHGGLRYLEQWEFALVRKALQEREVLLGSAPHLIRPLRFVMPHDAHLRPAWLIRAGLFLYDNLARRRKLASSAAIDLRKHPAGTPLGAGFHRGFIYSDATTDDTRLTVLNALDARERGATILTRTRCRRIARDGANWRAELDGAHEATVRARAIVNATGPWVSSFVHDATPTQAHRAIRLVKGSHIVVPQIFRHRFAYIFQNPDRRIVFAIPWERGFTLIGTTDVEYHGDPREVRISADEINYLCTTVNRYFRQPTRPTDVAWSFAGVRPLLDDAQGEAATVTRDYFLDLEGMDDGGQGAPLLSVFGGKITTFRKLSEQAVDLLAAALQPPRAAWTATAVLPGGDLPGGSFAVFLRQVARRWPWLPLALRERLAQAYGTRLERMIGDADSLAALGPQVLPGLYAREIEYLCQVEWAQTAADILWRRSKLGLHAPTGSEAVLDGWLSQPTRTEVLS